MTRFDLRNKLIEKMNALGYYVSETHGTAVSFSKDEYDSKYFFFEFHVNIPEHADRQGQAGKYYYYKVEHGFPGDVEYDIQITKEEQSILDEIEIDLNTVED